MSVARRLAVNTVTPAQRYVLWSNGRVDAYGGAANIALPMYSPEWPDVDSGGIKNGYCTLQITGWATPSGYAMNTEGTITAFGSATAPSPALPVVTAYSFYYQDAVFKPDGSGQGYALKFDGTLIAFGGAPAVGGFGGPSGYPSLPGITGIRLQLDWTTMRFYVLDIYGKIWASTASATPAITNPAGGGPYWGPYDLARGFLINSYTTGRGWFLGAWGDLHSINGEIEPYGFDYWPGYDLARDFVLVSSNPTRLVVLDVFGSQHEWTVSLGTQFSWRSTFPGTVSTTTRPELPWEYTDSQGDDQNGYEFSVYTDANTTGYLNDAQLLGIAGGIDVLTSGVFYLNWAGQRTAAIAYNATAANVQTALRALTGIGTDITCTGTTLGPSTPITISFTGEFARVKQPYVVADNGTLVGGALAVTRSISPVDPPSTNRLAYVVTSGSTYKNDRAWTVNADLANATMRVFGRVTDTSGALSYWRTKTWVQSTTRPAAPTLTAKSLGAFSGIAVSATVTSPPVGSILVIEYSDDNLNWVSVRSSSNNTTAVSGVSTIVDAEAPFGAVRYYRGQVRIDSPYLASTLSNTTSATLTGNTWLLSDPTNSTTQQEVKIAPPFAMERKALTSVFYPSGRANAVVLRDGALRGTNTKLQIWAKSRTQSTALMVLLSSSSALLLRSPWGDVWYFRTVDAVTETVLRTPRATTDPAAWPVGYGSLLETNIVQIDRP